MKSEGNKQNLLSKIQWHLSCPKMICLHILCKSCIKILFCHIVLLSHVIPYSYALQTDACPNEVLSSRTGLPKILRSWDKFSTCENSMELVVHFGWHVV